jgi:ribose transport system ATP-binding protein
MATHNKPPTPSRELLSFRGIGKAFFGVKVLKGVTFNVGAGRVAGLVGENGAGKSTLMNLLGGNLQPDAGAMTFNGSPYAPRNPRDARAVGIGFVHQELNLFPNLSIAENLFLTSFPIQGDPGGPRKRGVIRPPFIDRRRLRDLAASLLARVGLPVAPDTLVERLSSGERQLVEIAHALSFDAQLIILDEPTTSLSARECERLFALIRQLREEGRSLIYISHTLGDVLRLCDDLVILRDGEVVGQGPVGQFDQGRLVSLMVGRELKQLFPTRRNRPEEAPSPSSAVQTPDSEVTPSHRNPAPAGNGPLLEARNLSQPGVVRDISFTLHCGEVLGLSGLMGAGRTELARILFGLDSHERGSLAVAGLPLTGSPRRRIRRGVALLTESRREDGLCLEASVADNLALVTLARHGRTPLRLLSLDALRKALAKVREAVRLQPRLNDEQPVKTLSGGNQQKVVLAKWLLAEPQVLILDEPTRGIDVGAKFEIYQLIHELADRGAGVLVISSDLEELTGICDRILVMSQGRLTDELTRAEFDRERILQSALPK